MRYDGAHREDAHIANCQLVQNMHQLLPTRGRSRSQNFRTRHLTTINPRRLSAVHLPFSRAF